MAEAKRSWWKIALVTVVAIEVLGGLSGWLSNSGYGNGWFDTLQKPTFMPPGPVFGIVWPILYALLGIALAMILAEPPSDRRKTALTLFFVQLALNFGWSPIFFAGHDITLAKVVIFDSRDHGQSLVDHRVEDHAVPVHQEPPAAVM